MSCCALHANSQLWLDTIFCCFCCDFRRSLLVAVDVMLPAVSRLCPSLVSLFASSFAVTGFVSFDAGFNPHTKHHCSLLETLTNFELAVFSGSKLLFWPQGARGYELPA
jgi:hypothetical protein